MTEEYFLTFSDSDDAETFIQQRYRYWRELLDKELKIDQSVNETISEIEARKIFRLTANWFGLKNIMSKTRRPQNVEARRTAIAICLGRKIGPAELERCVGIDHSTIVHHRKKWENYMETERAYRERYDEIEEYVLSKLK